MKIDKDYWEHMRKIRENIIKEVEKVFLDIWTCGWCDNKMTVEDYDENRLVLICKECYNKREYEKRGNRWVVIYS